MIIEAVPKGRDPRQLYAGKEVTFTIKNLPPKPQMRMRNGYIKKINETTYKIVESKCHLVTTDTLYISTGNGFYQAVYFNVAATPYNDTNLLIHYGNSCEWKRTANELRAETKFYVLPESSGYVIDSFVLTILPKRGEYLMKTIHGSELKGKYWESVSKRIRSDDRMYFGSFYVSKRGANRRELNQSIYIYIK